MPSTGLPRRAPFAQRRRRDPTRAKAGHRRACGADARKHRQVRRFDVVDDLGTEPAERELHRAHVARSVTADCDVHRTPLVDGSSPALASNRLPKGTADGLERRLGDMVRIAARRLDMDRRAGRLGEARQHVQRQAGVLLECDLDVRSAAEVDRGTRECVVHRHDGVAVAGDAATIAERLVERAPEGDRLVLGRVVIARLDVTGSFEHEIEPGVERELLEKVVVQARSGRDAHAAGAVEGKPHDESGLGGRAQNSSFAARRPTRRATAGRAVARVSRRAASSSSASRTEARIAVL